MMDRNCGYRWPERFAKHISDQVHRQVQQMLGESRLTRNNDNDIQLVQPDDIFSIDRVLGSGAFSQVSAVTTKSGRRYACKHLQQKLMEKPEDFQLAASELAFEAHILSSFDHPNILKIRGWAANGIASFESGTHDSFFLLLDLLDETLDQRIIRWRDQELNLLQSEPSTTSSLPNLILDESVDHSFFRNQTFNHSQQNEVIDVNLRHQTLYLEKIRIMSEIASALDYIHAQGVVFRDLKPQNIGFSAETNSVQIFDFGLSRELPTLDTSAPFSMSGKVGTLRYMAPEVATNQAYNISSDVYSWAIVSYELLSLEKPFDGWTRDLHADLVCKRGLRPETNNTLHHIPSDMKSILEQAWSPIPSNRGTMAQIGVQLQCLLNNEMAYIAEQQTLEQQRQILEQQQQQMTFAVGSTSAALSGNNSNNFYIDNISFCNMLDNTCPSQTIPPAPTKISRTFSFETIESIETINTSPHSVDNFNYY